MRGMPAPPMIREPIVGPRAWTRRTIRESDWRIALPASCLDEIDRLARALERDPVPTWLLDPADYELHACRGLLGEVRRRLEEGPGVAVVDRLPIEEMSGRPRIEAVFWLLTSMVGRPVVQSRDGEILVEVTDTGVKKRIGVRGFRTNVAQPPHVDNSFNHAPPDHVSLLCLRAAREGGASRFVSFCSVHNVLLAERAPLSPLPPAVFELLEPVLHPPAGRAPVRELYRPFHQDRQGDFWPDEAQTVFFPVFELRPDLRCRYTHFTIPAGYETAGVEMDDLTRAAFETITRVVQDPDLCCEFTLRPGELQFVNNRWCGHGRTAYVDDPEQRRLMLRLWHRDRGSRRYRG